MEPKVYEGLPFFIGTGKKVEEKNLQLVQNAIGARCRDISNWRMRYSKGIEIKNAIKNNDEGAVKNVNMMYAYNAYFKYLHQSLFSLRDSFRVSTTNYQVDIERPTAIIKGYLEALQNQNDLLTDDAITFGCAAILLDINLDTKNPEPDILVNRVKSAKLVYDFEQPGSGLFTIRITPEVAFKFDFLPEWRKEQIYNKAIASAETVAEIRVFVGDLVVDNKLDTYIALIYNRQVIYAERDRTLTVLRAVSVNDKNDDFSPIYTVLRASDIQQDVYKLIFDYNEENANPIRTGNWNFDADAWEEAKRTRFLKTSPVGNIQLNPLLPGTLDVQGLVGIQDNIGQLAQQATGLNEYTKGEDGGSVRTAAEAMMLADSASGILNIFANKIKQQLILPVMSDILEILKVALNGYSDIFDDSLFIDTDVAKDQQEGNLLMSLINMPMFGAVIQGLESQQALQLFRWILEKLHITGTASVFDTLMSMSQQQNQNGVNK